LEEKRMANRTLRTLAALSTLGLALSMGPGSSLVQASAGATMTTVAGGLQNPRGLTFGPDGQLYVAEGGLGGALQTTAAQCEQVPPPVGPYSGGYTSRISKINPSTGARTTVASGLPSSQTSPDLGSLISGVADVTFIGNTLYALEAAAGCSHGLLGTNNDILRINSDGTVTEVANLSDFIKTHPVAHPNPPDFEPDGTWYSMTAVRGKLYAVEPNHGEVDVVDPVTGAINRLVDVSAHYGHIVPTSVEYHGNIYVGNLNEFDPGVEASTGVYKVTPSGNIKLVKGGLTAVVGIAFRNGTLYALEAFTGFFAPTPDNASSGTVVRLGEDRNWHVVATGLSFPTAMTFGPDGNLYVSNFGFGFPPGAGQVVKIAITGKNN
jgi:hypothetical protein